VPTIDEAKRISLLYNHFDMNESSEYSLLKLHNLLTYQRREREIVKLFQNNKIPSLKDYKILDVGCGIGGELRRFISLGANPDNLYGIDLTPERINIAKAISPNINFYCSNAELLNYENNYFDIIIQSVMFSSILDDNMKINIAKEMLRVMKPDGFILWYDFFYHNPHKNNVKGITIREIRNLFPGCLLQFKRIQIIKPILRRIPIWLIPFIENIKLFNNHYIGMIYFKRYLHHTDK